MDMYWQTRKYLTSVNFSFAALFFQYDMVQIVPEKCLKFICCWRKSKQLWKVMMLQSCYAVSATSILNSVSFHCFLAPVELEKELFAAWSQVPWPCKEKAKQQPGYMAGFSINQQKKKKKKR